jgi:cytochrome oxidase Cu insertion factor (SCO1/SenC/PrrC family)
MKQNVIFGIVLLAAICTSGLSAAEKFEFELTDVYGRVISSQDYKGVPIFLEFGSCW